MIKDRYLQLIKDKVKEFSRDKNLKFFIFGSSLNKEHFGDVDLGVLGDIEQSELFQLKEEFQESTLPYSVDIINFNKVSEKFKNNIFDNKILWITP